MFVIAKIETTRNSQTRTHFLTNSCPRHLGMTNSMVTVNKGKVTSAPLLQSSPQALNESVWAICDIMRRSNCASALQYVPELTWILFLRVLEEQEANERDEAEALGLPYSPSLASPYRWQDWAAPWSDKPGRPRPTTASRWVGSAANCTKASAAKYFAFMNGELLPYLRTLRDQPGATPKQKVISEIISPIERVRHRHREPISPTCSTACMRCALPAPTRSTSSCCRRCTRACC